MIGIQLDDHGYSLVGRRSSARWWRFRRSAADFFYCEKDVPESDLLDVGKRLLSVKGLKNKAALCLGPGLVKRFEFTVPAAFSAGNIYAWVEQNFESWLGKASTDCYFDYVPITEGNQTDFVLYSADRACVDQYLLPLRDAQFNIIRVEVVEQALPDLLSGPAEGDMMLADIGARDTPVYAISQGCCRWLGTLSSPSQDGTEHESVEIFHAGIQRLIVSLRRSPTRLLLAGTAVVATAVSHWLQPLLPGTDIQLVEELSPAPGEALLAASVASR